jgi:hypothetical protein
MYRKSYKDHELQEITQEEKDNTELSNVYITTDDSNNNIQNIDDKEITDDVNVEIKKTDIIGNTKNNDVNNKIYLSNQKAVKSNQIESTNRLYKNNSYSRSKSDEISKAINAQKPVDKLKQDETTNRLYKNIQSSRNLSRENNNIDKNMQKVVNSNG